MKKIPVYDSLEDVIAAEDFGDVSARSRTMIKNLPGVSITSKPRRDGRYQGYCISGDIKTYFYGRTQEEVAVKIKHFLQSGGIRKRKKRKDAVARNFRTVSAKLGFHVSAHILRHTYATRLEEAGVPAKVARYLMGHATIQMTKDVYTDVQDSYIKTFYERVIMFTDTRKHKD